MTLTTGRTSNRFKSVSIGDFIAVETAVIFLIFMLMVLLAEPLLTEAIPAFTFGAISELSAQMTSFLSFGVGMLFAIAMRYVRLVS